MFNKTLQALVFFSRGKNAWLWHQKLHFELARWFMWSMYLYVYIYITCLAPQYTKNKVLQIFGPNAVPAAKRGE